MGDVLSGVLIDLRRSDHDVSDIKRDQRCAWPVEKETGAILCVCDCVVGHSSNSKIRQNRKVVFLAGRCVPVFVGPRRCTSGL